MDESLVQTNDDLSASKLIECSSNISTTYLLPIITFERFNPERSDKIWIVDELPVFKVDMFVLINKPAPQPTSSKIL